MSGWKHCTHTCPGNQMGVATSRNLSLNLHGNLGFEVLTAVVTKSDIFWDREPCSPMKVNRRYGGTCPFSRSKNKPSRKQTWKMLPVAYRLLSWLIIWFWKWGRHIFSWRWLSFNGLHGVLPRILEFSSETVHGTFWIRGWVGSKVSLDAVKKIETS
jgi:hypothetical protein